MRLVLDPADEAAHGEWLRQTPGAYEWWYFDALSEDSQYALTCIWFLGNPFSPYYRQAARGQAANPFCHNAVFFALYREGQLQAYHFTRFPASKIVTGGAGPLDLAFGDNRLTQTEAGLWTLTLNDENANRRSLEASLTFTAPPLVKSETKETVLDTDHSWLPVAPCCRVQGRLALREVHNPGAEQITFAGTGYHDHNWGRLPFAAEIRDWYWARAALSGERAVLLYHVRSRRGHEGVSHFLIFQGGRLMQHDAAPQVRLSHAVINGFGTSYATRLTVASGDVIADFTLRNRLDSAPFYVRTLCAATLRQGDHAETGQGIGEYLRPRMMSWPLVASAMKARIVER